MALTPIEQDNVYELAEHLYPYLPGSPAWGTTYTFFSAAQSTHLEQYWTRGPKGASLEHFLSATLDKQRGRLGLFIETVVKNSLHFRARAGNPLSRNELDELNDILSRFGIEVKGLTNPAFRHSLPDLTLDEAAREQRRVSALERLKADYLKLEKASDPDDRNEAFERILARLVKLGGLRVVRRMVAEAGAVRGRFRLDFHTILMLARCGDPVSLEEFESFRSELRKSAHTLGLVLSVNGFDAGAVEAASSDPGPSYFMMDGAHLFRILNGDLDFDVLLRRLVELLAVRGQPYVPVAELLKP